MVNHELHGTSGAGVARRRFLAAVLVVALMGVSASTVAASVTAAKPKVWVKVVCTSIGEWSEAADAIWGAAIPDGSGTPAEAQAALVKALRKLAKRTDRLAATIEDADAPDVKGGKAAAEGIVATYETLADGLRDTRTAVKALSVDDPAAFAAALQTTSVDLDTLLTEAELDLADVDLGAKPLQAAIDTVPACTNLGDA